MKDTIDGTAVGRAPEPEREGFTNRKLIRPSLNGRAEHARVEVPVDRRPQGIGKKTPPPEQTHAENFYYQKQMQARTPMVFVLHDGETIHGTIEWYDKTCIKVLRNGAANLLIYKPSIKYIFKESEDRR